MTNTNLINYIFIYGQVIAQLIMYIAIIYLICWPLRDVLYATRDYLRAHATISNEPMDSLTKDR